MPNPVSSLSEKQKQKEKEEAIQAVATLVGSILADLTTSYALGVSLKKASGRFNNAFGTPNPDLTAKEWFLLGASVRRIIYLAKFKVEMPSSTKTGINNVFLSQ